MEVDPESYERPLDELAVANAVGIEFSMSLPTEIVRSRSHRRGEDQTWRSRGSPEGSDRRPNRDSMPQRWASRYQQSTGTVAEER